MNQKWLARPNKGGQKDWFKIFFLWVKKERGVQANEILHEQMTDAMQESKEKCLES